LTSRGETRDSVVILRRAQTLATRFDVLLTLDVGNTNITIGIFEGAQLRATWRIATNVERLADEYAVIVLGLIDHEGIRRDAVDEAVMATVVPDLAPVFEQLCRRYFGVEPLVVGLGTKTGVRIVYDNPRDVGADRIVDVVAALHEHGPPPLIIVDFGTATVFDAVSAEGDYLGGAIAPGIGIASEALFERAAKLYRVELERPKSAIGRNTVSAIQSGTLFGYVGLIEGMVARFKKELGGKARVIATGGWAHRLARETRIFDAVDENLTLTGLRLIHEMHVRAGREAHAAG
jgi:type III pantothenate kinase